MMEQAGIPAVICFNKKDLAQEEETEKLCRIYRGLRIPGDPFQHCKRRRDPGDTKSAPGKDNGGGRSFGCGKILLTNILQPEVKMETGEISRKLKRGRHTTRHSQVVPIGKDTYLMDTPGFSSLYLTDMEEQELKGYFRLYVYLFISMSLAVRSRRLLRKK